MCNLTIDKEVLNLIKIYRIFDHEVGGILFGYKDTTTVINAISFKHGEKYRLNFTSKDGKIFDLPKGMEIIGTWHTHPFQNVPTPSDIDIVQWEKWGRVYCHMIVGEKMLKIYSMKKRYLVLKKWEEIYEESLSDGVD